MTLTLCASLYYFIARRPIFGGLVYDFRTLLYQDLQFTHTSVGMRHSRFSAGGEKKRKKKRIKGNGAI
jgi:hypothetical protein